MVQHYGTISNQSIGKRAKCRNSLCHRKCRIASITFGSGFANSQTAEATENLVQ